MAEFYSPDKQLNTEVMEANLKTVATAEGIVWDAFSTICGRMDTSAVAKEYSPSDWRRFYIEARLENDTPS